VPARRWAAERQAPEVTAPPRKLRGPHLTRHRSADLRRHRGGFHEADLNPSILKAGYFSNSVLTMVTLPSQISSLPPSISILSPSGRSTAEVRAKRESKGLPYQPSGSTKPARPCFAKKRSAIWAGGPRVIQGLRVTGRSYRRASFTGPALCPPGDVRRNAMCGCLSPPSLMPVSRSSTDGTRAICSTLPEARASGSKDSRKTRPQNCPMKVPYSQRSKTTLCDW
jgi:hypothetical protein